MEAWFDSLKAGHAFMSTGPLVELTVNGAIPGETVSLPEGGGSVDIQARVRSITPLTKVMLIWNGDLVEEIPLTGDRMSVTFEKTLSVTQSGWYHLRAEGDPAERFPLDASYAQAFTNPTWVTLGEAPVRSREAALYALRWIDKLQQMADEWPGWRSQKEKDHVYEQFEEARQIYRQAQ